MGSLEAEKRIRTGVDLLGGDAAKPVLVFANPFHGQRLIVPRDVRAGDTPEGAPAVLWKIPGWKSRDKRSPDYARPDWGRGALADQAIWAFLRLADETRLDAFVAFTQNYGPLGLWPYRTPTGHKVFEIGDDWVPSIPDGIQTPHRFQKFANNGEYRAVEAAGLFNALYEPISEWRRWAQELRAILLITLALRSNQLGPRDQWAVLGIDVGDDFWRGRYGTVERQRDHLASFVQHGFLKWSGLTPVLRWNGSEPEMALAFGGRTAVTMRRASMQEDWPENSLFPALVANLLAIMTASNWISACTSCGQLHPRNRKPRADQPAYCDKCKKEAIRKNKRVWAAEARSKKRPPITDA